MPGQTTAIDPDDDEWFRPRGHIDRLVHPLPEPWSAAIDRFFAGNWVRPEKHQECLELLRIQRELRPAGIVTGETIKQYLAMTSELGTKVCRVPVICMDPSDAAQLLDRRPGDPWPRFHQFEQLEKSRFGHIFWPIDHGSHWSLVHVLDHHACAWVVAYDSLAIVTGKRTADAQNAIFHYCKKIIRPWCAGYGWFSQEPARSVVFGELQWGQANSSNDGGIWAMLLGRLVWDALFQNVLLPVDEKERQEKTSEIGRRARLRIAAELIARTTKLENTPVPSWLEGLSDENE